MKNHCYNIYCISMYVYIWRFSDMKKFKAAASLLLALLIMFGASAALLPITDVEAASPGTWIASWSTAGVNGSISLENYVPGLKVNDFIPARSVVRIETQLSAGGTYSRYRFSNQYGTSALTIGGASVALTDTPGTARILADTATPITFNDGQPTVTINPGETIWSDTVYFPVDELSYVTVSMYIPNTTYIKTGGLYGSRAYLKSAATTDNLDDAKLNMASEIKIASGTITYHTTPFMTGIDVRADYADAYSVVFIGDSTLTNEVHHYFAQRAYNAGYQHVGFVNNSIVANRLLYDGVGLIGNLYGESVLKRFQRDVLDVTGAKAVLVKIGLNDILHPMTESMKGVAPYASVDDIINGYKQIIAAARAKGLKVYFFTNTAWNGYERSFLGQTGDLSWTQDAQVMCDQLDAWIKSTNLIDGYFDMSPLSSPVDSTSLLPAFTTDGAHLTSLGAVAMADLIDPRIIGASSLRKSADIKNVDPYASVDEVISAYYATSVVPTTGGNSGNSGNSGNNANTTTNKNNNNNNTRPAGTTTINDYLAESVLASREQAEQESNRNPQQPNVPTTKAPSTTKAPATTTKPANNNTQTSTTKQQSTTAKQDATTKPSTTANASAVASSVQASLEQAQSAVTSTTAAQQATAEPAGDATYADTALMNTTEHYYSVSVDLIQNGEAGTVAAEPPVVATEMSGNGTLIGVVLVIVLVGMVVGAVVITMKTKRRSDME